MSQIENEFELIAHDRLVDCSMFLVDLIYRPPHIHRELELCYVMEGEADVYHDRNAEPVQAGDVLLFDSGVPHEIRGRDGEIRLLALQISRRFCNRYFPQLRNTVFDVCRLAPCFSPDDNRRLKDAMLSAFSTYLRFEPQDVFLCMSQINRIFSLLFQNVPYHELSDAEYSASKKNAKRLHRILRYLDLRYQEPVRLCDLAKLENLTETYISHFFRSQLHMTFQEYLSSIRLERAIYLLRTTSMSLTDIALECGFSDVRYLNQNFLRSFGMEPKLWRNSGMTLPIQTSDNRYTMQRIYSDRESLDIIRHLGVL